MWWPCPYFLLGTVYTAWTTTGHFKGENLVLSGNTVKKCAGKYYEYVNLICCLQKFAACQWPRLGMLWRDCWVLSNPWTITPCCSFMWSSLGLPGATYSLSKVTTSKVTIWGRWSGVWRTGRVLQNPAGDSKGSREEGTDSICQQLVADLVLATGFWFLWSWDFIWRSVAAKER